MFKTELRVGKVVITFFSPLFKRYVHFNIFNEHLICHSGVDRGGSGGATAPPIKIFVGNFTGSIIKDQKAITKKEIEP